ncbi:MAG: glycosyltransferase family 2 protein [Jatrophihabitantaceae bacterium]
MTHASTAALAGFLSSLREATTEPLDVVIAHLGPPDTSDGVAVIGPGVRVIEAGDVGYGRAANLGVRDTTAEFVVISDPDVTWEPGSLDRLLAASDRWPQGAAFGPLIRTRQGTVYPSARAVPSLKNGIGHALWGRWWPGNPWTSAYRQGRGQPAERTTGWLADTCLLLRRDAFDTVGGFESENLVYLEDLDLGERFTKAGWHNVYVPSAAVVATGRQNGAADRARLAADRHRSVWTYVSRRYAGWRWWPVRVVLRGGLTVRSAVAKRRRPRRASEAN